MGQSLRCLSCESRNTKVKSFGTVPRGKRYSKSTLSVLRNAGFHRPMHSSLERFSEEVSRRSSLASISLGSAQTLSSIKVESANKETTLDAGNKDGSPSTKRHPGLLTPEPDENDLNSAVSLVVTAQGYSSPLPMTGGRQSRGEQPFRISSSAPQDPSPTPSKAGIIMVKPYQDSSVGILGDPERMCKHGMPLSGVTGNSRVVDCALCERPISRGGRVLAGMMAFREAKRKQSSINRLLNQQKLMEEQEKRKRMTEEYNKALCQFAERQENQRLRSFRS